jgi:uncharacterized protein (UPF0332 family)
MREYARAEWQRALRALQTARRLATEDAEAACSRAYYCAFHAVSALFALRDRSFSKHTALRAALHRELIHTGSWVKELGLAFDFLLDMRETADYGGMADVSAENAAQAVQHAEQIIAAVREACPELRTE